MLTYGKNIGNEAWRTRKEDVALKDYKEKSRQACHTMIATRSGTHFGVVEAVNSLDGDPSTAGEVEWEQCCAAFLTALS